MICEHKQTEAQAHSLKTRVISIALRRNVYVATNLMRIRTVAELVKVFNICLISYCSGQWMKLPLIVF